MNPIATQDVTVLELPFFDVQVSDTALGSEVARLFEQNHVVMNQERYCGMVCRNQFFQRLGRPFGIEIYTPRPITVFLESAAIEPISLRAETTIQNAIILCLARPIEFVYDPFVVAMKDEPPRVIDFLALILKQTELLTAAQIEAHAQRAAAISAHRHHRLCRDFDRGRAERAAERISPPLGKHRPGGLASFGNDQRPS
jgi:hypothetical protein